ncbi:SDR family oxidoreductase [Nocardioides sp. 1609]|uniref:SDR family NAD(P)-dependent oxidoreductase n=1 Tax=Nocardioides sp. 1609 TaxID=2508327 RepID=UPI00106F9F2D|nr:SDR family oxidoreductase [Nocardioides sp. 1609]
MTTNRRRVALVTGAAAGLGQAFAQRLAVDGHDIVAVDLRGSSETVAQVEAAGRRCLAIECDITDEDAVTRMNETVLSEFDGVDVLVNNAGIYPKGDLATLELADWRKVFAVNVEGAFLVTRAILPTMTDRRWGRIVFTSSVSFQAGSPGFPHYVSTKGALIGLMHALATELAESGITVNAVAPSIVETESTRRISAEDDFTITKSLQAIHRTQQPSDVVGALSFLVSDDAAFMTGQTLVIDGGLVRT